MMKIGCNVVAPAHPGGGTEAVLAVVWNLLEQPHIRRKIRIAFLVLVIYAALC